MGKKKIIIPKCLDKEAYEKIEKREKVYRKIISIYKKDGRATLSNISKQLGMPITTLFEYVKRIKEHYDFTIVPRRKREDGDNKKD